MKTFGIVGRSIFGKINRLVFGIISKLLVLVFWIIIWYAIYVLVGRELYVPSPFAVGERLLELVVLETFWVEVFHSIVRVTAGVIISMLAGLVLGVAAALNKAIYAIVEPMVSAIRVTPVLSFIILALIWLNSNMVPVFICLLMCFPIIWTNVVGGIRQVDMQLLEMAKVYQVTKPKVFSKIYLPTMRPYFVAGTISALGLGWKVSVAAEILSYPRYGIGSNIYSAKAYIDTVELFAWTAVIIMLSMLFEKLLVKLLKTSKSAAGSEAGFDA